MEAKPASGRCIRLISPLPGAIDDFEEQTLEVSVWALADDFRAYLNGREVSARFEGSANGVRSAHFERGKGFEIGPGSFMAGCGGGGGGAPAQKGVLCFRPA